MLEVKFLTYTANASMVYRIPYLNCTSRPHSKLLGPCRIRPSPSPGVTAAMSPKPDMIEASFKKGFTQGLGSIQGLAYHSKRSRAKAEIKEMALSRGTKKNKTGDMSKHNMGPLQNNSE